MYYHNVYFNKKLKFRYGNTCGVTQTKKTPKKKDIKSNSNMAIRLCCVITNQKQAQKS